MSGGRYKPFSEYTHLIGWVDTSSQAFEMGIRPGDEINKINGRPFSGFNDLIYSAFLDSAPPKLEGVDINYLQGSKKPFAFELDAGKNLEGMTKAKATVGLMSPASYLVYDSFGGTNPIEGSPLKNVGLQDNDRIIWVDGNLIFSQKQLVNVVNEPKSLLTIVRNGQVYVVKVPRVQISDLRLNESQKVEIKDWFFASGINGDISSHFFLPYEISADGIVNQPLQYLDENLNQVTHEQEAKALCENCLQQGDKVIAIDGISIKGAVDLTINIQHKRIQIIVQRGENYPPIAWKQADQTFFKNVDFKGIDVLSSSIGTEKRLQSEGNLCLLAPVEPKTIAEYPLPQATRDQIAREYLEQKNQIEKIKDPQQRDEALKVLEENQNKLVLGIQLHDRPVVYNPSPIRLFYNALDETWRTVKALFTGYLSPKYMSGPVGIVQAIHHGWSTGINEAMYWIAIISLNLGILNLLPIPVLDGGHICISIWESVTKKRLKAKTMERLIIPFIVLMLLFFLYATYNDIIRLISKFF